jgi:hypothetical protein
MAWRITDYVEHGEIDNRSRDQVTGRIWIRGLDEPIRLELEGNAWRDLAGQRLCFRNPAPKPIPEHLSDIALEQIGVVGDITAARKVKVLDIPDGELEHYYKNKLPMPYHWGNCLYLEWHSQRNGRVVIEATEYELTVEPEAAWQMSEAEEAEQHTANAAAMTNFLDRIVEAAEAAADDVDDADDDLPQSNAEAVADAEAARMDLLLDRVTARMDREGCDEDDFEDILEEECERLRKERGEPEPDPTPPMDDAEREALFARINEATEAALNGEAEPIEHKDHPLVTHCHELGSRLHKTIQNKHWLPEDAHEEHPLNELVHGVWFASAKLAGALNGDPGDWPPDSMTAGNTLVRLKKARGYLNDAIGGLNAADAEKLTDPAWLQTLRQELDGLQQTTQSLIDEVRAVLRANGGEF